MLTAASATSSSQGNIRKGMGPTSARISTALLPTAIARTDAGQVPPRITAPSASPVALDGAADAPPIRPQTQPPPPDNLPKHAGSTKRDAATAGLDTDGPLPGRSSPPARCPPNTTPCFRCFLHSWNNRSHECIAATTRPDTCTLLYPAASGHTNAI